METIHQFVAALDIFSVLINAFPSIFQPLVHGFESLYTILFSSLRNIVATYPGLISGTVFMTLVYFFLHAVSKLRKARA